MRRAADLESGWSLWAEWAYRDDRSQMDIAFVHRDGRRRNPYDFAGVTEARVVFRAVKRMLDEVDLSERVPMVEFRRAALERAKMALQLSLIHRGTWDPDLLETDLVAT